MLHSVPQGSQQNGAPEVPHSNLLINMPYVGFLLCVVLLFHSLTPLPWNIPHKPHGHKSLSQALLLGKPRLRKLIPGVVMGSRHWEWDTDGIDGVAPITGKWDNDYLWHCIASQCLGFHLWCIKRGKPVEGSALAYAIGPMLKRHGQAVLSIGEWVCCC